MVLDRYHELGQRIEAEWRQAGMDARSFPAIAMAALSGFDPPDFDLAGVGLLLRETTVAQQPQTRFSNLPVTLFVGEGFYLELLVWTRGTTSIHQHGFSGAFRVIAGSSLHTDYGFTEHVRLGHHIRLGDVRAKGMRLLQTGDAMPITSGPDGLTHALFHLDNPSATLVARTFHDPDAGPQFELMKPGIALDTPWTKSEPRLAMLSRWLGVCADAGSALADPAIVNQVQTLDPAGFCWLLLEHGRFLGLDRPDSTIRIALEQTNPDLSRVLVQAFHHGQVQKSLIATRKETIDPELRFFVALLMNAPSFADFKEMIRAQKQGVDAISQCAQRLLQLGTAGGKLLALQSGSPLLARLSMALGNAGPDARSLLEAMLRGGSVESSPPELAGMDAGRLQRLAQSEKALRTTPELSVLFGQRGVS